MAKSIDDLTEELRIMGYADKRLYELALAFITDHKLARDFRAALNAHAYAACRSTE